MTDLFHGYPRRVLGNGEQLCLFPLMGGRWRLGRGRENSDYFEDEY